MDAVVIGSILAVVGAVAVIAYLGYKVGKLIDRDAERHRES
ncbi:MAG: hypothetical protein R3298_01975 [Gammaproteobacteria bacterium]|nr:hypothetical protein [Gammaproteobacteria bacterium]